VVIIDLLYVIAWIVFLAPVLSVSLWVYSWRFDPVVRALQLAGLLVIAATAVGLWALWRLLARLLVSTAHHSPAPSCNVRLRRHNRNPGLGSAL
jgi:ABC-type nickel/cobalt efflux system permease component RcnA